MFKLHIFFSTRLSRVAKKNQIEKEFSWCGRVVLFENLANHLLLSKELSCRYTFPAFKLYVLYLYLR